MTNQSRRSFLKGSLASAATVASASFVTQAYAQPRAKVPAKWDETVDVIVVGSGFAGLAAAIEAKKAGANVVVLEKMPTVYQNPPNLPPGTKSSQSLQRLHLSQ